MSSMPRSVLSLHCAQAMLPGGWARDVRIAIAAGLIVAVEADVRPLPGDERHEAALPGLPNLHSHAFQRGMAGLAERRGATDSPEFDSFWSWREVMYRFLDRLTPEDVLAIAALAYAEMLESGFTRVGEFHYLHHDRDGRPYADPAEMAHAIAAAAGETGIGLTLLPVFYAHAGFGEQPAGVGQRRFLCDIERYVRLHEVCTGAVRALPNSVVGIAPHSLRAVSERQLALLQEFAPTGPVHIHVAEQLREVDECLAWSGQRPVEWLLDHASVDPRWCLVHATHITADESARLAASGAVAGLCPITEANLGDGIFPAQAYLRAGGSFGLGSDSNVRIDAAEELRWLEYGQRLVSGGRNALADGPGASSGGSLVRGALAGGARALGAAVGIAPGLPADLVMLDAGHPDIAGKLGDAALDGWIFAGGREAIASVWLRGECLVERGRHRDRRRIEQRYKACVARLA